MAELADALDSGSSEQYAHAGSSPVSRTKPGVLTASEKHQLSQMPNTHSLELSVHSVYKADSGHSSF